MEQPEKIIGLNRDDLPMETAEEAVNKLKEMYPGFTVKFAGDATDETAAKMIAEFNQKIEDYMYAGKCLDCGAEHSRPWPPNPFVMDDGWECWDVIGHPDYMTLSCPACTHEVDAESDNIQFKEFKP